MDLPNRNGSCTVAGTPLIAILWVLMRDPQGIFVPQALLSTDQTADLGAGHCVVHVALALRKPGY